MGWMGVASGFWCWRRPAHPLSDRPKIRPPDNFQKSAYNRCLRSPAAVIWTCSRPPCPGGEIGRRRGLKIPRRKACRFDSGPGHQKALKHSPVISKPRNANSSALIPPYVPPLAGVERCARARRVRCTNQECTTEDSKASAQVEAFFRCGVWHGGKPSRTLSH